MQVQDVLTRCRSLLGDFSTVGRYGNDELLAMFNQAQLALARELRWPVGVITGTTSASQQEYALPELLSVERVYLGGQQLAPTSIPLMQGNQVGDYDSSGTNSQPSWFTLDASTYPISNGLGAVMPFGMPTFGGDVPLYYMRGANIGFVPRPAGAYAMVLHTISKPPTVTNLLDDSVFPYTCLDALAWWIIGQLSFGDSSFDRHDRAAIAYQKAEQDARAALDQLNPNQQSGVVMRTYRGERPGAGYRGLLGRSRRGDW